MNKLSFAIDKNLGFVINDPNWQRLFKKYNVTPVLYEDMGSLTKNLEENQTTLSYLPTANYFFLKQDSFYVPIANALFASTQTSKISSLLCVSKDSGINTLEDLKGKRLGVINFFCTSSYFSAAILLSKHQYSIHNFFSSIQEVGAWQLQVDAVIAGKVDATMIQEDVWHRLPSNAENTKIIAREDNLPSPTVLASKKVNEQFLNELKELLYSYKPKAPPNALFNGFVPFQKDQVETFFNASTKAFD